MSGPFVGTVFPEISAPFWWPSVAEVRVISQTWLQAAFGVLGWTIHDVINDRRKRDILASAWGTWRSIQRSAEEHAAHEWADYLTYLKTMGL